MAIIKEDIADKIETLEGGQVQVRTATVIKEGTAGTGYTWGDTDISGEEDRVQAICNAVWTSAVKTAYQEAQDALE